MLTVTVKDGDAVYLAAPLDLDVGLDEEEALLEDNLSIFLAPEGEGCYLTCTYPPALLTDLLRCHPLGLTGKLTSQKMINEFLPALKELAAAHGQMRDEDEDSLLCSVTVAKDGVAFCIDADLAVNEIADFLAEGRRERAATAALLSTVDAPPLERIRAAFTAAALDDPHTTYFPVLAVNTKTGKRVILRGA